MALLEIEDVTVKFGGVTAVKEASLSFDDARITGLIGPNGAGKTTLFNVVTGLQAPTAGRVRFDGRNITRRPPHRRARIGIGRTFQRLEAFGSLSVADNVRVAGDIGQGLLGGFRPYHVPVAELLERVGIAEYAQDRADAIPTGPARLLELARCLAVEPRMLLLDEPSSGLDESETEELGRLLAELAAEGRAIVMVEHDMDLVMTVCDVIHVLDFGEVIATGSPTDIRRNPRVQEAYLGADAHREHEAEDHTLTDMEPVTEPIPVVTR
jgi:branched-chain amino acid transport system ATP-binding protein